MSQGGTHVLQQRQSALDARARKEQGNKLFKAGKIEEAIPCYKAAIELEPWDEAFHLNLALCYTKLEKWETVIAHADKAIELRWSCIKAYYRKAYAELQLGKVSPLPPAGPSYVEKAWETIKTVVQYGMKQTPNDKEALKLLEEIRVHWEQEKKDKAQLALAAKQELKALEYKQRLEAEEDAQALALLPTWSQKKELAGRCFKASNFEPACELYTEAIELLEGHEGSDGLRGELAAVYNNRGACHRAMDRHQETIDDCSQTLRYEPDNFKALVRRGLSYEAIEQMQLALLDLKRARALEPGSAIVMRAVNRVKEFCKIRPDEIDYNIPPSDLDDIAFFL